MSTLGFRISARTGSPDMPSEPGSDRDFAKKVIDEASSNDGPDPTFSDQRALYERARADFRAAARDAGPRKLALWSFGEVEAAQRRGPSVEFRDGMCFVNVASTLDQTVRSWAEHLGNPSLIDTPENQKRAARFILSHEVEHCRSATSELRNSDKLEDRQHIEITAEIRAGLIERAHGMATNTIAETDDWLNRVAIAKDRVAQEEAAQGEFKHNLASQGLRLALSVSGPELNQVGAFAEKSAKLDQLVDKLAQRQFC